jgi:hypothetical protein
MKSFWFIAAIMFSLMKQDFSVCAQDFAIIGTKGQVFFHIGGKEPACTMKTQWLPGYMHIYDAYFDSESSQLIVACESGIKYEMNLKEENPKYQLINHDPTTSSVVIYDTGQRHPFWLRTGKDGESSQWVSKSEGAEIVATTPCELLFTNRIVSPIYIHEGSMSTQDFIQGYPRSSSLLNEFKEHNWIIVGRSRSILSYMTRYRKTQIGESNEDVFLFQDRMSDEWNLFHLSECGRAFIFDEVAVIRGTEHINDGKKIFPSKPSGTWYFYFPGADNLVVADLGPVTNHEPWMEVLYATSTTAYIAKGAEVYLMDISPQGAGEPRKVLTVPDGVVPFRIYPLP